MTVKKDRFFDWVEFSKLHFVDVVKLCFHKGEISFPTYLHCFPHICTASHTSALLPTYLCCFPHICTASNISALLPTYLHCFPHIYTASHISALLPTHLHCFPHTCTAATSTQVDRSRQCAIIFVYICLEHGDTDWELCNLQGRVSLGLAAISSQV